MIALFLFGEFTGKLIYGFGDPKFLQNSEKNRNFDPLMVFNIASSLYGIGEELKGGKLRDLDMKSYRVITDLDKDKLLVIGIKNWEKVQKKAKSIKDKISEIHTICQTVADRIDRKDLITNADIKDAFLLYFRNFPIINKEFKKLEQILI